MNSMYAGMEGYTDPSRYNNDPRPTEVVTKDELSKYPELGAKGVGVSKQYAGREPRFYASVAYNGSVWHMLNADINQKEEKDVQIFYYRGESDGYKIGTNWLNTGIGIKKFVHPNDCQMQIKHTMQVALRLNMLRISVSRDFAELCGSTE